MFNKCIFALCIVFLMNYAGLASDNNPESTIHWSCYDSETRTSVPNCYPIAYETIDDSGSHFNGLCNFVAALNWLNPVINIGGIWLNNFFRERWNRQIATSIDKQLEAIKSGEREIRRFLAAVVMDFDNGINSDKDRLTASILIENLNEYNCEHCIAEFVALVSEETLGSESSDLLAQGPVRNFRNFARKISGYVANKGAHCSKYKPFTPVGQQQKGIIGKVASACFRDWNHPSHLSTAIYALAALSLPAVIGYGVSGDPYNRSGSYGGDMANISNLLTIVPIHLLVFIQNWRNCSHIEIQKLAEEINKRIADIAGIIEIAGRAIGEMENKIAPPQARGFIKALILIGWPQDLVEEFQRLASSIKGSNFPDFVQKLNNRYNAGYHKKKIPYVDEDIEAALQYCDTNGAIEIELTQF